MELKELKREFVERTVELIKSNIDTNYEVTMLTNCLYGLVTIPTESTTASTGLSIDVVNDKLKSLATIKKHGTSEQLFRALKNSLSHMHFQFKNADGEIVGVCFWDQKDKKASTHTEFYMTIDALREYALFIAEEFLKMQVKENK